LLNYIIINRTEQNLDKSGISIAPPMRPRAVTQTIVSAPIQVPPTHVRKQEPSGNETQSSDSESSLYGDYKPESTVNLVDDQQMQVDDVQLGDGDMGRVGYDAMGEGVGDGDEGDYGDRDRGMGYYVQLGDGEMGRVGYDAMGEGVGDGDEGDYGDDDRGMGYDEHMSDGASPYMPASPLFSFGGNWPGDVGYDQHMHYPSAGGGAHYRAAADEELPSPHLQVPKNPGFHRSKDHHAIPLNPDAIVNHFDTPRKPKR
jgi:hypothetical protein